MKANGHMAHMGLYRAQERDILTTLKGRKLQLERISIRLNQPYAAREYLQNCLFLNFKSLDATNRHFLKHPFIVSEISESIYKLGGLFRTTDSAALFLSECQKKAAGISKQVQGLALCQRVFRTRAHSSLLMTPAPLCEIRPQFHQ